MALASWSADREAPVPSSALGEGGRAKERGRTVTLPQQ